MVGSSSSAGEKSGSRATGTAEAKERYDLQHLVSNFEMDTIKPVLD